MKSARFTDLELKSSGAQDFIVRRRTLPILHMLILFVMIQLIVISVAVVIADKYTLVLLLVGVMTMVSWYLIAQTQRNRDLLLATEFQNALFASALGMNHKFCMIIKRDGNIIYFDRAFQDMFPDFLRQRHRSLHVFLEQSKVSREDCSKVFGVLERNSYENVILNIRSANNQYVKIVMSIEPILRPSGFILMRGREFVESRASKADASKAGSMMDKSPFTIFASVMDNMNVGIYMCGASGAVAYASPLFEKWLGYAEGELAASNRSLQDIIHYEAASGAAELANYDGDIVLRKKTGELVTMFVNQKILLDDGGHVVGCTGIAHQVPTQSDDVKKKAW